MNYYGLVGEKLSHSLSPKIHEYIFEKYSVDGGYELFPIPQEDISEFGKWMKLLKIKGVNVTIPYKERVIEFLDEISDEGKKIGAVNTILNKNGTLIGYNTDYYGFKYMLLEQEIYVKDKIAVVLGTGGASKAVIQYLKDEKAKDIYLVSRDIKGKKSLDKDVKLIDYEMLKNIEGYVLINTTPVGMYPKLSECPVNEEVIKKYQCIVDLIYNPLETEFIKLGIAQGKKVCGGLMMLVYQGVKADEIWEEVKVLKEEIVELNEILKKEFV
ncbi:shikimate dehydrogenase [uncultured Clostridium sp.]|uniref:shikimate dehydrogenase n=1 Tax=uncultured Clostridium sp. TaxID=59620 RepID=UPI0026094A81|nr:shikimate dehydrogenase [uncultured Clostridium sp.]